MPKTKHKKSSNIDSKGSRATKSTYDHKKLAKKWRIVWSGENIYTPDVKNAKRPFMNLMMFPYPSAEGLHVGSMYAFGGADVYGRYQRMNGYDVFEPIGLDGFGIHSENFAIKMGRHPKENADITQKNFYRQLSDIGNGFAWNHRLETYDPEYYKWTQWLFVQLFKSGLAYRDKASVNWCPSCKTVLADEQVEHGECERCGTEVERREMSSWYFRITDYADRLLENIDGVGSAEGKEQRTKDGDRKPQIEKSQTKSQVVNTPNTTHQTPYTNFGPVDKDYDPKKDGLKWPEMIKIAQKQWIGKKAGINIKYEIKGQSAKGKETDATITCFTTRPDTNFGATFVVVSPEYAQENLLDLIDKENVESVSKYIKESLNKSEQQRLKDGKKKTGAFTGLYAVNNLNGYEMPIYVADFVLSGVGTGAVVGVPGHDKRDFEFATAFDLPVIRVVVASDEDDSEITKVDQVQEAEGKMVNSEFLDGLPIMEAKEKMMEHLVEKGWGEKVFNYHLRDWLISRQRYWGPPIPMIHCAKCAEAGKSWLTGVEGDRHMIHADHSDWDHAGWYPVPEEDLPVELPDIKDFKPKGDGTSPLANAPEDWKHPKCPGCGDKADRELDVSDTFLDSSWYFLRYPSLGQSRESLPWDPEITKKWLPVSAYIGGAEHAVLHLLYARFTTMVLHDLEYLDFEEPFPFLFGHGLIIKDGAKMSKSKGNVINPDDYIEKFGADALRCYLMFLGSYDAGGDFRDTGMEGMKKFIARVWDLAHIDAPKLSEEDEKKLQTKLHQTIKKCSSDMPRFKFNTSIAAVMELVNLMREVQKSAVSHQSSDKIQKPKDDNTQKIWSESVRTIAQLLAPFAPHMTEEIWREVLGEKKSVHVSTWPAYNEDKIVVDSVQMPVQVNGKLRATVSIESGKETAKEHVLAAAKENESVAKWIESGVKKEIFVPGRLVNFVT